MAETSDDVAGMPPSASVEPLLQRLDAIAGSLRKSERKVAELVAKNPELFLHSTMAAVAEAAGVSEPTVMRFCAGLGFDGFQAFKIALAQALALGIPATHSAIDDDDTVAVLVTKIFDHTLTSLDRARRNLDTDAIERAVDTILGARQLLFIGFGASGIIATDAAQKFSLFGVPCMAPTDAHQQFIAASMSEPGTVLVAISNTGRTHSIIQVAEQARRNGAKIIAITGVGSGPLVNLSDVTVVVKTFEDTDTYTPTVSRLSGLVVIDILATSVAAQRGSEHRARVRAMKDGLASFRTRDRLTPS